MTKKDTGDYMSGEVVSALISDGGACGSSLAVDVPITHL